MMRASITYPLTLIAALAGTTALAQSGGSSAEQAASSVSIHLLPAYVGGATTLTAATPNTSIAARSVRVTGSWQLCSAVNYAGTCQTVTADQPLYRGPAIRSARPTPGSTSAANPAASASATAGATAKLDLDALDTGNGTTGQDVDFYATPAFGSDQVSASTNDKTAGDAFCKRAGASSSAYASRGRVQQSNLIDLATATKVRGFPLRDVLCRR